MEQRKRVFKAKICDNFLENWIQAAADYEDATYEQAKEWYYGDSLEKLADRIEGEIVEIEETKYKNRSGNWHTEYFEVIDNNYVLHPQLFTEVNA